MESRYDKFSTNSNRSRTSKNKDLYDDLYKDTDYSNMVVLDDAKNIDFNKIKEIIVEDSRSQRQVNNKDFYNTLKDIYKMENENKQKKIYDINEVLKEAKNKRDIIEEANEKRKIENYKFRNNLDLENELQKTRRVYNDLVKEETELLNIMNTLTNINQDGNLSQTTSMAYDLLEDLKDPSMETSPVKKEVVKENTNTINVKKVDDDTKEYSTDTFMFNTRDFDGLKNITDQVRKTNIFIKIFMFIFTVVVVILCYFIITKYVLK